MPFTTHIGGYGFRARCFASPRNDGRKDSWPALRAPRNDGPRDSGLDASHPPGMTAERKAHPNDEGCAEWRIAE
jgi:hypothetical protein